MGGGKGYGKEERSVREGEGWRGEEGRERTGKRGKAGNVKNKTLF